MYLGLVPARSFCTSTPCLLHPQLLQALSYMCLDNFERAVETASAIEVTTTRRFRVSSWAAVGAPLLKGLLPISLLKAFAHYVDTQTLGASLGVGGTTLGTCPCDERLTAGCFLAPVYPFIAPACGVWHQAPRHCPRVRGKAWPIACMRAWALVPVPGCTTIL